MNKRIRQQLHRERGFTLVEIMIVVAIIALLVAIAVPGFLRARKRTQAGSVREDLRLIDSAMDQYGLEYGRPGNSTIPVAAWKLYLKSGSRLYSSGASIFGDVYGDQVLGVLPTVPSSVYDSFSDVTDASYWAPYVKGL